MRLIVSSLVYSSVILVISKAFSQVTLDGNIISSLLQIPMVAGLIYLVLALEDKRSLSTRAREETFVSTTSVLVDLIKEMIGIVNESRITGKQYDIIEAYLKQELLKGKQEDEELKMDRAIDANKAKRSV